METIITYWPLFLAAFIIAEAGYLAATSIRSARKSRIANMARNVRLNFERGAQ